jgi:GTP cyclohydrolase I
MSATPLRSRATGLRRHSLDVRPIHDHTDGASAGDSDLARVAEAYRGFLESLGLDLADPDLAGTDYRVARAYRELLGGLRPSAEPRLSTFPNTEGYAGIVSVTGIPFYSICAHHFLPFFGRHMLEATSVGLSRWLASSTTMPTGHSQERLTGQVAGMLDERLAPGGVIVAVEARHLCMEMRGVSKPGATTTTIAVRGTLKDERLQQQFFLRLRGVRADSPALGT